MQKHRLKGVVQLVQERVSLWLECMAGTWGGGTEETTKIYCILCGHDHDLFYREIILG